MVQSKKAVIQSAEETLCSNDENIEPISSPKKWLAIEMWDDNRQILKALIEHIAVFSLLIGALVFLHFILQHITLPPERTRILEDIDFWGIVVALLIFAITFSVKLVIYAFRGVANDKQ